MKLLHCPKYEQKNLKNSAQSVQGRNFQIFRSYFGQREDSIFSFWNFLTFTILSKCRAISIHQVWLTTFPKRLTMMLPTTSKAWRSWNKDYHFEQKRRGYSSSRKLAQAAFCLHLVSGTQTLNKEKPLKNKRREEAGRRHFAAPLTADVRAYSTPLDALWSAAAARCAAATPTLLQHYIVVPNS